LPPHVDRALGWLYVRHVNSRCDAHRRNPHRDTWRAEAVHVGSLDPEFVAHVRKKVRYPHTCRVAVYSHQLLPGPKRFVGTGR
jgi:hypothetical protein